MNVGDLYWVEFPARGGHVQQGRRPAIIMQVPVSSSKLPTVLVIPLTTQLDALRFPGTVLIETDTSNGLRRNSVALVFQLMAVDQRILGGSIGHLSKTMIETLKTVLVELMK